METLLSQAQAAAAGLPRVGETYVFLLILVGALIVLVREVGRDAKDDVSAELRLGPLSLAVKKGGEAKKLPATLGNSGTIRDGQYVASADSPIDNTCGRVNCVCCRAPGSR